MSTGSAFPSQPLKFALPPSLSPVQAQQLERYLQARLGSGVQVAAAEGYEHLFQEMRAGRTHASWAPPFLCARLESQGLRVVVWGLRKGLPTYRSALVARAGSGLTLDKLQGTAVAWVDAESTAGYLLPYVMLKGRGLEPAQLFRSQAYLGTYRRALEAVRDGTADVAPVYCPPEATGRTWEVGLEEALPGEAAAFELVSYTDEAPNAGVVVANSLSLAQTSALEEAFVTLGANPEGRALLQEVFSGMERFERAPKMSYRSLYRLAVSSL